MTLTAKGAFDVLTAAEWNELILGFNPTGAVAKRVAVQSLTSAAPNTYSFDTEEFDNAGMFAPTSTSITVPTTAVWSIGGWQEIAANTSGMRSLEIALNGSTLLLSEAQPPPSSFSSRIAIYGEYYAAAGSTFTLIGFQNSGGALNATARMSVFRKASA
jgi:hypothetical protein